MTTILDRIWGNCEKGLHRFKSFEIARIPPRLEEFRGIKTSAIAVIEFAETLTQIRYEVRCEVCGCLPSDKSR